MPLFLAYIIIRPFYFDDDRAAAWLVSNIIIFVSSRCEMLLDTVNDKLIWVFDDMSMRHADAFYHSTCFFDSRQRCAMRRKFPEFLHNRRTSNVICASFYLVYRHQRLYVFDRQQTKLKQIIKSPFYRPRVACRF